MFTQIKAIVKKYLLKALRNKMFYSIIFISIAYIYLVTIIKFFDIEDTFQFLIDFSLSGIFNMGVLLALTLGVNEISSEIKSKSIYLSLSKPLDRLTYLIGKLLGILIVLFIYIFVIGLELIIVISKMAPGMILQVIGALLLIFVKLGIISAFILLFSLLVSPVINVFMTLLVSFIGHISINYINVILEDSYSPSSIMITKLVKFIFPSFEFFKINEALIQYAKIDFMYYFEVMLYGLLYTFFILLISNLVFREKEL